MEQEAMRIAGKGFGGAITSAALWAYSLVEMREVLQFVAAVLSILVAMATLISLYRAVAKSKAEELKAGVETDLFKAEHAEVMARLCSVCRSGKVPVTECPLAPDNRPADCPKKLV